MKNASFDYILKTVMSTNILPVTSFCTTGCVFCSHKNNPGDIETYSVPNLTFEEIKTMCEFLRGDRKIVIGESASRIIEGEPFLREDIIDILKHIRQKFPRTALEITTSGNQLTVEMINEIKKFEPIEINLSLNSCSEQGRSLLFKGGQGKEAIQAPRYLKEAGISFNGSIVAMPDIAGYQDIEDTLEFLSSSGASTIRVFVPGFSKLAKYEVDFFAVRKKLQSIADKVYETHKVPVLVEPPEIEDLEPEVIGVIKDSPAQAGGIEKGDIIAAMGDYTPLSRVDAYNALYRMENPEVVIKRQEKILNVKLQKKPGVSAGAVFYYDIHPDMIKSIDSCIKRNKAKRPVVATSRLAYPVITMGLEKMSSYNIDMCLVDNKWFGGSIMCTGLLTVKDIISGVSQFIEENKNDLIILPPAPFDTNGRDLAGHYFYEIQDELGIKTDIAE